MVVTSKPGSVVPARATARSVELRVVGRGGGHVDVAVRQRQDLVLGAIASRSRSSQACAAWAAACTTGSSSSRSSGLSGALSGSSVGVSVGRLGRSGARRRVRGRLVLAVRPAPACRLGASDRGGLPAASRRTASTQRRVDQPGHGAVAGRWRRSRPASGAGRPGTRVWVQLARSASEPSAAWTSWCRSGITTAVGCWPSRVGGDQREEGAGPAVGEQVAALRSLDRARARRTSRRRGVRVQQLGAGRSGCTSRGSPGASSSMVSVCRSSVIRLADHARPREWPRPRRAARWSSAARRR